MNIGNMLRNAASSALGKFLKTDEAGITLSCNGNSLALPVMPESFSCSVSNKNGTVNINNLGEYNMVGKTGLKTISLSSFFPNQDYDFAEGSSDAYGNVDKIEGWRTSGNPLNITITGSSISFPCLIESFTYSEKDGSGDVYYTISLKEYKYIETQKTTDKLTNLTKRPKLSYLQRTGLTAVQNVLKGQSPMRAITGAVEKSGGLTPKQTGYLDIYKMVTKQGGLKVGDILQAGKSIKINGKNIINK